MPRCEAGNSNCLSANGLSARMELFHSMRRHVGLEDRFLRKAFFGILLAEAEDGLDRLSVIAATLRLSKYVLDVAFLQTSSNLLTDLAVQQTSFRRQDGIRFSIRE